VAFGFPARFTESRTFPLAEEELLVLAKAALADLRWSYEVQWGKQLRALPPRSSWTWGEELTIKLLPGGVIHAESRCAGARPQIFDFGKNRRNVELFFARVDELRGT
jgi:hypothetical protein